MWPTCSHPVEIWVLFTMEKLTKSEKFSVSPNNKTSRRMQLKWNMEVRWNFWESTHTHTYTHMPLRVDAGEGEGGGRRLISEILTCRLALRSQQARQSVQLAVRYYPYFHSLRARRKACSSRKKQVFCFLKPNSQNEKEKKEKTMSIWLLSDFWDPANNAARECLFHVS